MTLRLTGHAGQSLAAWAPTGLRIDLEGACNDYAGKGLCGGVLTVRPFERAGHSGERSVLVGNTVLYGATGGEAYLCGRAGERFAVRNSGATAVIEGVGDHGCEYMTGGVVLILGPVGRNFAAGMTGGVAYVFDPGAELPRRLNPESVDLEPLDSDDQELVIDLLHRHFEATRSPVATRILGELAGGCRRVVLQGDAARAKHAAAAGCGGADGGCGACLIPAASWRSSGAAPATGPWQSGWPISGTRRSRRPMTRCAPRRPGAWAAASRSAILAAR